MMLAVLDKKQSVASRSMSLLSKAMLLGVGDRDIAPENDLSLVALQSRPRLPCGGLIGTQGESSFRKTSSTEGAQ